MSRIAGRLTKLLVLAGIALAVTASAGDAAGRAHGRILGLVPHLGLQSFAPRLLPKAVGTASATPLTFDASYQSLINQYFTDVQAGSGTNNVYNVATQYGDGTGPIQYQSTFGGSYVARDPLPANGCDDGLDDYCLTDQQLENEIQTVLTANDWHGGLDHLFFLMTPDGVGSCFDASTGECSTNAFCAYHSFFTDSSNENVLYANEPDEGPPGGCDNPLEQGFPNDVDADTTINTISHEHNEAITDPLTDPTTFGWIAADGSEIGDLCAYGFGPSAGGTAGVDAYNQVINGHHYDLQQEYSNADKGCVQNLGGPSSAPPKGDGSGPLTYVGGPVMHTNTTYAIYWLPTPGSTTAPAVTGTTVVKQTLASSTGSWTAAPTNWVYQWQRCSSLTTGCVNIPGATSSTYTLTTADGAQYVRSTVSAANVNGTSVPVASASQSILGPPQASKTPHISGRAKVGKKLAASKGSWSGPPTAYRLQWLRCSAKGGSCKAIGKATSSTYKLTKMDAGHRLRIRVTAVNAAGNGIAISAPTAPVKH